MGSYHGKVHKDTGSLQHPCQGFQGAWNLGLGGAQFFPAAVRDRFCGLFIHWQGWDGGREGMGRRDGEEEREHHKQQDLLLASPSNRKSNVTPLSPTHKFTLFN